MLLSQSSSDIQPFHGYVDTTEDALRLIEAARRGVLPRVTRRLNELERRSMIRSGAVFVFSVEESGIKRWTEGLAWSQSRISGNFLIYREVTDRSSLRGANQLSESADMRQGGQLADGHVTLKPGGLIKKTITVKINRSDHHLISYFTQEDVRSGRLHRPTSRPDLMTLKIPSELLQSANFRYPLKLEGQGQYSAISSPTDDNNDTDSQRPGSFRSPTRTVPRPPRLDVTPSGLSPVSMSGFSRTHSVASYTSQSREGQLDGLYSSRPSGDLRPPLSPTGSPTSPYGGSMDGTTLSPLESPSWSSSYNAQSFAPSGSPSTMYTSSMQLGQMHPTHLQRDEAWSQHAPGASRVGREFEQNVSRLDVGAQSDLSSWTQGSAVMDAQQLASAPPISTSISEHFPLGRGRDHMRTRSFPPEWQWGHDSASSPYHVSSAPTPLYSPHHMHHSPN